MADYKNLIQALEQDICNALNKQEKSEREEANSSLFHYTSIESMLKIFKSSKILYSDYSQMNDPLEYEFGIKIVLDNLREIFKDNFQARESVINKLGDLGDQGFKPFLRNCSKQYIFCLCNSDDYFPMWRYYGNNGYGVALGFSNQILRYYIDDVNMQLKKKVNTVRFDSFKVKYQSSINNNLEFIWRFSEKLNTLANSINFNVSAEEKDFLVFLHTYFFVLIPQLKILSFKDESEYRLVLGLYNDRSMPIKIPARRKFTLPKNCSNIISNQFDIAHLSKYPTIERQSILIDIKLEDINTIIIGPALKFDDTKKFLTKQLLKLSQEGCFCKSLISNIKFLSSKHAYR